MINKKKRYNGKRLMAIFLSLIMCLSLSYVTALAEGDDDDIIVTTDPTTTVTVTKSWITTGDPTPPTSLAVQLTKNGAAYMTATLTSDTSWTHTWTVPNDGSTYIVTETVPANYTQGATDIENKTLVINSSEVVNKGNMMTFSDWTGAYVVVKKGGNNYVWTYTELSPDNKNAFIEDFNNRTTSFNLSSDDTFVFGIFASIDGITIDSETKTLSFDAKSNWSKFAYGDYDGAGKNITLSNKY
jgi:hypothetical protein